MDDVDWIQCNQDATKSIVKEVCEHYNSHNEIMIEDICSMFNISDTALRIYLHIGNDNGWCNYIPYTTMFSANNKRKPIPVDIYDEYNNFIISYNSLKKAGKNIKEDLNISASECTIKKYIDTDITYKGFIFKTKTNQK